MEAAFSFYSMHVGVAAMAVCSIAQRRIAERAAFLRSESEAVSYVENARAAEAVSDRLGDAEGHGYTCMI